MSSAGAGGRAPGGSHGGILPGGHAPSTGPRATPTLAEVVTFLDWFVHSDDDDLNGVSLLDVSVNLDNHNPADIMTILVSLESAAHLAFFGLFPSTDIPHGQLCLLLFPHGCPHVLCTPSPLPLVSVLSLMKLQVDRVPQLHFLTWRSIFIMPPP